jgi:nitronate monooxygenase
MQRNPRLPQILQNLTLPLVAAPMFIASNPKLVIEQCKAGIVGSFPALNARPKEDLDKWLTQIQTSLADFKKQNPNSTVGPIAVNQIVHVSNDRLQHDVEVCVGHKVPIFITSLRAPPKEIIDAVHSYGGLVFHDVINVKHAKKALEAGVDGLILVAVGAGGHAGPYSPLSLVAEVRQFYNGPLILSGAIATGRHILAAQACGADLAYMGTRFLATPESSVVSEYKQCLVDSSASDVVYTNYFTGVHGNYLRQSIVNQGLDPENLPVKDKTAMQFGSASGPEKKVGESSSSPADSLTKKEDRPKAAKAWKDIWGAGTGCGSIDSILPTGELVQQLKTQYQEARKELINFSSQY